MSHHTPPPPDARYALWVVDPLPSGGSVVRWSDPANPVVALSGEPGIDLRPEAEALNVAGVTPETLKRDERGDVSLGNFPETDRSPY